MTVDSFRWKGIGGEKIEEGVDNTRAFPNSKSHLLLGMSFLDIIPLDRPNEESSFFTRDFDIHQVIHSQLVEESIFIIPISRFCSRRIMMKMRSFLVVILVLREEIWMLIFSILFNMDQCSS